MRTDSESMCPASTCARCVIVEQHRIHSHFWTIPKSCTRPAWSGPPSSSLRQFATTSEATTAVRRACKAFVDAKPILVLSFGAGSTPRQTPTVAVGPRISYFPMPAVTRAVRIALIMAEGCSSAIRRPAKFSTADCQLIQTTSRWQPFGHHFDRSGRGVAFCNDLGTASAVAVGGRLLFRGLSRADPDLRVGDGEPSACSAV